MRPALLILSLCLAVTAPADQATSHHFDSKGAYQAEGFPEYTPQIFAVADKPVTLHFSGLPADWQPIVRIYRVNSTRMIELQSVAPELSGNDWRVTWTPPETLAPAQYVIRLQGEPNRAVRIESRSLAWFQATQKMLTEVDWEGSGLTAEERTALSTLGIRSGRETSRGRQADASLEMRPRQGAGSRRRVVWDEKNPHLVVWRPGPATGDLEVRAPRWWIFPAALATDHGLIRFLDLFTEPPLNP